MTSPAHSTRPDVAQPHDVTQRHHVADEGDPRVPNSFVGALAFTTTLVVGVGVAKMASGTPWQFQLSLMAAAVALASWWCRPLPSLFVSACGWLALNGIDVNGNGQLGWSGDADVVRLTVLIASAVLASGARTYTLRPLPRAINLPRTLHLVRQGAPHA